MAWHFSNRLIQDYENSPSSPEPAGASSEDYCSGTAQSAPSSATPTHGMCWSLGKTTDVSPRSQSGMTYVPLTDAHGAALLMSFLADFPVRTLAQPGREPELTASDPDYGAKWRELSARYDPSTSSWRTHRCLFTEALDWSLVTWPQWGMILDGVLWERIMPAHLTSGTGSGLWATPTASEGGAEPKGETGRKLVTQVKLWPTPKVSTGDYQYAPGTKKKVLNLSGAVKAWATPQARDFRTGSTDRWNDPKRLRNLDDQIGGQLNPTWVEWLMGWPLGWTDCAVSATDRSQQWPRSHGLP